MPCMGHGTLATYKGTRLRTLDQVWVLGTLSTGQGDENQNFTHITRYFPSTFLVLASSFARTVNVLSFFNVLFQFSFTSTFRVAQWIMCVCTFCVDIFVES